VVAKGIITTVQRLAYNIPLSIRTFAANIKHKNLFVTYEDNHVRTELEAPFGALFVFCGYVSNVEVSDIYSHKPLESNS
jgi:hypothetical protein